MGNTSAASIAALVALLLALLFAIISMATDHWSTYEISFKQIKSDANKGLLKACSKTQGFGEICRKFADATDYPDYIKACLGGMVLGFLFTGGALIIWIFWILGLCRAAMCSKILKIVTVILLSVGLFWVVIAVIVYAAKDEDQAKQGGLAVLVQYTLSWSWGLAIGVGLLQAVGLVMICFAARKEA